MNDFVITKDLVDKIHEVLDRGLSAGKGVQDGQMCVEAAVCYAMGLPHDDNPPCVNSEVRMDKINLNDFCWSSPEARASGMRKIAIAQLGSVSVSMDSYSTLLGYRLLKSVVPILLRAYVNRWQYICAANFSKDLQEIALLLEKEFANDSIAANLRIQDIITMYYMWDLSNILSAALIPDHYNNIIRSINILLLRCELDRLEKDRVLTLVADEMLAVLTELNSPGVAWL